MPSHRLSKVQKHITKKKGKNANLHENSRDTHRLQRAAARDDKLNRLTAIREKQNSPYLLRVKAFQSYTLEHTSPLSTDKMQVLVEDYLGRHDEELAQIEAERRPGRPPSGRETGLKQRQANEQGEYVSGFWIPDLEDMENLQKLKDWDGKWSSLATLIFVRVTKDCKKKPSSFPPKGMS